jgi:hypothetical protein
MVQPVMAKTALFPQKGPFLDSRVRSVLTELALFAQNRAGGFPSA